MALLTVSSALPHQPLIKEKHHRLSHRQSGGGHLLNWASFVQNGSTLCQVDTKLLYTSVLDSFKCGYLTDFKGSPLKYAYMCVCVCLLYRISNNQKRLTFRIWSMISTRCVSCQTHCKVDNSKRKICNSEDICSWRAGVAQILLRLRQCSRLATLAILSRQHSISTWSGLYLPSTLNQSKLSRCLYGHQICLEVGRKAKRESLFLCRVCPRSSRYLWFTVKIEI